MSSDLIRYIFLKIPLLVLLIGSASCAHLHNTQSAQSADTYKGVSSRVVKVCEGIYRGPRLGDLNELKSLKVRTILNLENNTEAVGQEETVAKELGIEIIKIPMSEIARPRPADLKKAVEVLNDPKLQPVYVHCLHGRDRTGLVVAAYRILHDGWSLEQAYREAIDNGHTGWLYNLILGWKKSLRELPVQKAVTTAAAQDRLSKPVLTAP